MSDCFHIHFSRAVENLHAGLKQYKIIDKKLNHKLMSRVGMYWVRKSQVSHHHAHLAKGSILYGNVCGLYNMSHPGFHLVCIIYSKSIKEIQHYHSIFYL